MLQMEHHNLCLWISGLTPPVLEEDVNNFLETKVSKIYIPNYQYATECCVVLSNTDEVQKALRYDQRVLGNDTISVTRLTESQYATVSEIRSTDEECPVTDIRELAKVLSLLTRDKLTELMTLVGSDELKSTDTVNPSTLTLHKPKFENADDGTYETNRTLCRDTTGMTEYALNSR